MRAREPMGCASPETRGRAAHWLTARGLLATGILAALWLIVAFAASIPAQALPRLASDPSLAVQRDLARMSRQLEADLPDLVDTASCVQIDSDAAVPRRIPTIAFTTAAPDVSLRPSAVLAALLRAFNPRAPPSLR